MRTLTIAMLIIVCSCSVKYDHEYEKSIGDYVKNNIGEPQSYEPLEFSIASIQDILEIDVISNQFMNSENAIMRANILLEDILQKFSKYMPDSTNAKITNSIEIYNNDTIEPLLKYDILWRQYWLLILDFDSNDPEFPSHISGIMYPEDIAQFEGVSNRILNESKELDNLLAEIYDFDYRTEIIEIIEAGRIIKHKYRITQNGTKSIMQTLFVLSKDYLQVINTYPLPLPEL